MEEDEVYICTKLGEYHVEVEWGTQQWIYTVYLPGRLLRAHELLTKPRFRIIASALDPLTYSSQSPTH